MSNPSTPTREAPGGSQSTPLFHKVSSVFSHSQIDSFVARELDGNILSTEHATFLEHVLGVPSKLADEWKPFLKEVGQRAEIRGYLTDLAQAKDEKARYKPFADMANFILDEAHAQFPLPDTALPDLRFARSDPAVIKGSPAANTPDRRPDVTLVRREIADRLDKGDRSSVFWTDILCAIEFKVAPKRSGSAGHPNVISASRMANSSSHSKRKGVDGLIPRTELKI